MRWWILIKFVHKISSEIWMWKNVGNRSTFAKVMTKNQVIVYWDTVYSYCPDGCIGLQTHTHTHTHTDCSSWITKWSVKLSKFETVEDTGIARMLPELPILADRKWNCLMMSSFVYIWALKLRCKTTRKKPALTRVQWLTPAIFLWFVRDLDLFTPK